MEVLPLDQLVERGSKSQRASANTGTDDDSDRETERHSRSERTQRDQSRRKSAKRRMESRDDVASDDDDDDDVPTGNSKSTSRTETKFGSRKRAISEKQREVLRLGRETKAKLLKEKKAKEARELLTSNADALFEKFQEWTSSQGKSSQAKEANGNDATQKSPKKVQISTPDQQQQQQKQHQQQQQKRQQPQQHQHQQQQQQQQQQRQEPQRRATFQNLEEMFTKFTEQFKPMLDYAQGKQLEIERTRQRAKALLTGGPGPGMVGNPRTMPSPYSHSNFDRTTHPFSHAPKRGGRFKRF